MIFTVWSPCAPRSLAPRQTRTEGSTRLGPGAPQHPRVWTESFLHTFSCAHTVSPPGWRGRPLGALEQGQENEEKGNPWNHRGGSVTSPAGWVCRVVIAKGLIEK